MITNFSQITKALGNKVEIIKDGKFNSFSLLNGMLKKSDMLLVYIEDEKYISELIKNKEITCVICKDKILRQVRDAFEGGIVSSLSPRSDFFEFHNYLNRNTNFYNIDYNTRIAESAEIDLSVKIPKKNVTIGENTKIRSNVVIYENTIIGDNVLIREGTIIGNPAFYYFNYNGKNEAVDSVGGVVVKDNVEIHSNVVVSKGTLGNNTEIGEYSKIDSNVYIAHDVKIKENCLITASVSLAGGATINSNTFIGIGAKVIPLITIGKNCKISAGAVVTRDVKDNTQVSGNFAISHDKFINFIKKLNEEHFI